MRSSFVALLLGILACGPASAEEEGEARGSPARRPPTSAAKRLVRPVVRYLCERGADLMDVVELNVGVGRGAKSDFHYGIHFFGLGDVRSWRAGVLDRRVGYWRELDTQLGLLPLSLLACPVEQAARVAGQRQLAADARFVLEVGTDGVRHLDRKEFNGDPEFILKDTVSGAMHTRWGDSFPIGGEVHLGIGARAYLRPLQLVDFIVGFVGIELDPWLTAERGK